MKRLAALCLLLWLLPAAGRANWRENLAFRGYVRETPLSWKIPSYLAAGTPGVSGGRQFTNLLHTRENLRWYASSSTRLGLEVKTRLFSGDGVNLMLSQTEQLGGNQAYFNWDRQFISESKTILISTIDRAWVDQYIGAAEVTFGRQRVAWGTAFVWNPIDIFNPSNPLDFDNEEKPGSDAGRVQVYLGPNSKVEAAVAPARKSDNTLAAAELVLNQWDYDWVVMGGRRGPEAVAGAAWAGDIRGGGFRGELLASFPRAGTQFYRGDPANPFLPPARSEQDKPYLMGSIDGDYTFSNTLYLHGAMLFNSEGTTGKGGSLQLEAYARHWLSPSRMSLFAQLGGNPTPLIRIDLTGILNPYDHSWYTGPTFTWSVITNLDFIASGLIFGGERGTEFGDQGEILMGRLKYSF